MRILAIADFAAPYRVEVFKGIAEEFEIDLFFTTSADNNHNIQWYMQPDSQLNFGFLDEPKANKRFKQLVKNITQYDAVLCYNPWAKAARKLQRLCIRRKIPYILNADGALEITTSFPKKQIKTFYCKKASLCFAGCERAVQYFRSYGVTDDKIIHHPFTSFYAKRILERPLIKKAKDELKTRLGLDNKLLFLSVGRFIELKGFDILLDAWKKTKQDGQLLIIGGGPLCETLLKTIKDKKLKNVTVLGYKCPDELEDYYSAADVFVMPTRGDIWGLVVNEALASGLPVISSDRCTAGNELIENGINGFVYPVNDIDRLSELIDLYSSDNEMRSRCSENALHTIKGHTFECVISRHIESIKKLLR